MLFYIRLVFLRKLWTTTFAMDSCMVWVDLEMTGLDIQTEVIMEMACVITDKDLNVITESEDVIIKVYSIIY